MSVSAVPPAVRSGVGAVDVESLTCFATPGGEREHLLLIELLSREKPLFFHASECRVDRTWARPPPSRTTGLKFGDQLIAVHGSLGENDEQRLAHGPTPGPLRPPLAKTASLTHVSTTSFPLSGVASSKYEPDTDYEHDNDISFCVKRGTRDPRQLL